MAPSLELTTRQVMELIPLPPFHFDATVHKPDHFPASDNAWQPGVRWQTMRWDGQPLGLKFENQGTRDRPQIDLSIWSQHGLDSQSLAGLAEEIGYRYNLHMDLTGFYRRFAADPLLGPIIQRWQGMRPMTCNTLYEYLIVAIVLQNAAIRRSVNMMQALFERYGTLLHFDGVALHCFWPPAALAAVSEEELRGLKIGYRARSIQRVTTAFIRGEVDEHELRGRPQAEQRAALLNLYGIGPASVVYLLTDVFHQMDVLDHISPWEQKIYSKLFFDTDPEAPVPVPIILDFLTQRFAGVKMLAVHYIWEDLFWQRKHASVPWLEKLIRL